MKTTPSLRSFGSALIVIGVIAGLTLLRHSRPETASANPISDQTLCPSPDPIPNLGTCNQATGLPTADSRTPPAPATLTGDAAKAELRKNGEYESLGAALAAARHAVEKIDPAGPNSRGAEYYANNPGQQLRAWFTNDGVELASGIPSAKGENLWNVKLRLRGIGRGSGMTPVFPGSPAGEGSRVEIKHHGVAITQWFVNRGEGLEQGFTLENPPEGRGREIIVWMDVEGTLNAEAKDGAEGACFVNGAGCEVLHYRGLKARDASGQDLPARMECHGSAIALHVSDEGAEYPVVIDPIFGYAEAKLAGGSSSSDWFGSSVALSGNTAVIGVPRADTSFDFEAGCVYVFVRNNDTWHLEAKLLAENGAAGAHFGSSVALIGDTVVIGAPDTIPWGSRGKPGSAYVFVREGPSWTQQAKLLASVPENEDRFGDSVAVDGDRVLVGAPGQYEWLLTYPNSAYVFVRNGSSWTLETRLSGTGRFGRSVALSGDTALVGAPRHATASVTGGGAYVFVRKAGSWTQEKVLVASDRAQLDEFGSSVALSGDRALVGAPKDDGAAKSDVGSAYVFARNGSSWTEEGKLLASDPVTEDYFGSAVALDGETALISSPRFYPSPAAEGSRCYLFVRNGGAWEQQAMLSGTAGPPASQFGTAVALSGDMALIGEISGETVAGLEGGSAYVFTKTGDLWTQAIKLTAKYTPADDAIGSSVVIRGNNAVIGAPYDDTLAGKDAGSAYVFVRRNSLWREEAKLTAADGAQGDCFGCSVAWTDDTAVVGASRSDTAAGADAGCAYVFSRGGSLWSQQAKLIATEGGANDNFGYEVAASGDTVMVGVRANFPNDYVEVFVREGTSWIAQAKLIGQEAVASDEFGSSIALEGDVALIGAPRGRSGGAETGMAHVFVRSGSTWNRQAMLTANDAASNAYFGGSVALAGDTALVGAPWVNLSAGDIAGCVYVFERIGTAWQQAARLVANDAGEFDYFGWSVALSGDTALVGAQGHSTAAGSSVGCAYVITRNGAVWNQEARLTAGPDASRFDNFGASVSLSADTALVGAPGDNTAGEGSGSAYVFLLGDLPEITRHPESQSVAPGQAVTFRIEATGYEPLHCQWRKNGDFIADANSFSLTVNAAELGDEGVYDCLVTNIGGSTTSAPAVLSVDSLSQFEQLPPSAPPGSRGIVVVTISPAGIGGAWRFVGEQEWRDSGTAAQGLATGDRVVEFRPITGYQQPLPEPVAVIGDGTVRILNANYSWNGLAGSGRVEVILKPDDLAHDAQWRFVGEDDLRWRTSGTVASGLAPGNYLIECKPVAGRAIPPPANVTVGNNTTATLRLVYSLATSPNGIGPVEIPPGTISANTGLQTKIESISGYPPTAPGALKVILGPTEADGKGAAWRLQPSGGYFRSGTIKSNLLPGNYDLYLNPVAGFPVPPQYTVKISGGALTTVTYHYASDPAAFVGQLRSAIGSGTGFVVKRRVVATAGHVVFDDATLAAATSLEWLFQRDRGNFDPVPLTPRGFLLLDSYAAQRATEGTPGSATPVSQERDMAAVWFYQDAGRGGYGGFLASDAADNEWLISDTAKTLAGYPVVGIAADKVGRIHATPLMNLQFTRVPGEVMPGRPLHLFATNDIYTSRGNSGGPLCVQLEGGAYYPAAIYIGGSNQTIVRSIDSEVVGLFNRAEFQSFGGDNSVGGGVTLSSYAPFGTDSVKGALKVVIEPAGASAAPAGWRLSTESIWRYPGAQLSNMTPGTYFVNFSISNKETADKYLPAAPQQVVIVGGKLLTITFTFAASDADADGDGRTNREEIIAGTDPKNSADFLKVLSSGKSEAGFTLTAQGRAGRAYALQRTATLSNPSWADVATAGPSAADGPVTLTDTMPPSGKAFYRIQVTMP